MKGGIWLADGLRQEEAMRGEGQKRKDEKEITAKIKEGRQKGSQQMSNFLSAVRVLTDYLLLLVFSSARIFGCSGGGGVKVPSTSV